MMDNSMPFNLYKCSSCTNSSLCAAQMKHFFFVKCSLNLVFQKEVVKEIYFFPLHPPVTSLVGQIIRRVFFF